MSRSPSNDYTTASQAAHFTEIVFVEFQFASGNSYVCTADRDVSWNSQTWLGKGRVGSIEPIEEAGELEARGIVMSLSALPAGLIATALDPSEYKNRKVRIWRGLVDTSASSGMSIVADPVGPFIFLMDRLEFELGETGSLRLTAESRLADWQRPRGYRYNDATQQALYAGDDFFKYVENMSNVELIW